MEIRITHQLDTMCFSSPAVIFHSGMNNALYVLGALVSDDLRSVKHFVSLAVHRIHDIILTDRRITFDMPDAAPGTFGLPWHEPRRFRIHFKPSGASDYVRERQWADDQLLFEQEDGSLILELVTRSEPELSSWVRSFGEDVLSFDVVPE